MALALAGDAADDVAATAPPAAPPRYSVDLVVLGDASVGKTALVERFVNGVYEAKAPSTIGVEGKDITLTIDEGLDTECIADVTIWDFAGHERYARLTGDRLRGADGCVLVFDLVVADSFAHINLWHDEFLQNSAGGEAYLTPPFVLVGNKCDMIKLPDDEVPDVDDLVARQQVHNEMADLADNAAITPDEIYGWSGEERVDAGLWGADSPVVASPVPYHEVSAATGRAVRDAFIDAVKRGIHRQQRLAAIHGNEAAFDIIPPPTAEETELLQITTLPDVADSMPAENAKNSVVTSTLDVKVALMGDAATGKSSLLTQCKMGDFAETYTATQQPEVTHMVEVVDGTQVKLTVCDVPGRERLGPLTAARACHVCMVAAAVNSARSLDRANLWKDIFLRETGIRDETSVLFILLHTKSDLDDVLADVPSAKARVWAESNGFTFVPCNATEYATALAAMTEITRAAQRHRLDSIYERITQQIESAELGRQAQERILRGKLEKEREALFEKHPPRPAHAYIDGKVWAGKKQGQDVFIESPMYSFPVKNLKGEVIEAGDALQSADHLPLLLGKLSDLRNDMAKIEQDHKDELENLRSANLLEVSSLRRDLQATRAALDEEQQKHDELRWELRQVWQTLESK